jgi:8-oxo-dGTP pyrophosphatase MutT (NUDIX family)
VSDTIISVVAALIRDPDGRVLLVRKRGTEAFMQPGGKRDVGESDVDALSREIAEELGCGLGTRARRHWACLIVRRRTGRGFRSTRLSMPMSKVRSSRPGRSIRSCGLIRTRFLICHSHR